MNDCWEGFLLLLLGPVVLTLLDNVAASKSLSLNHGKSMVLWFVLFSCERGETVVLSVPLAVICPLSAEAPLAVLLQHQGPARAG